MKQLYLKFNYFIKTIYTSSAQTVSLNFYSVINFVIYSNTTLQNIYEFSYFITATEESFTNKIISFKSTEAYYFSVINFTYYQAC